MDRNKNAVDIFNKRAEGYRDKYMDVSLYGDSFDLFCSQLTKNAEILELACGPGNITKYLLNKRPDLKILGTDLAPNMLNIAKAHNPTAKFQLMDCRDLVRISKKYDGIMCGFCLPYLTKEEAVNLISDAYDVLNPNGVLYISTMEDDYHKSDYATSSYGDTLFMYYHQADYLSDTLLKNRFQLLDLYRKRYPGPNDTEVTDLILLAIKY